MIQIFGTNKSFDTKRALMFFKERRLQFQFVDLKEKEMSRGEFDNIVELIKKTSSSQIEAIEKLIDTKSKDYASIAYLEDDSKLDKLFENQNLFKLPICRYNKMEATVGLAEKIWAKWK